MLQQASASSFFYMGNAASIPVHAFCAARDADYAALFCVLDECFGVDIAILILDHFDWAYDTRFTCKSKCLQTEKELRTTEVQICVHGDATLFYKHTHMYRDLFDGDTEISEDCLRGTYYIQDRQLVAVGELVRTFTRYKQTFDSDSSSTHVRLDNEELRFYRDDLFQYNKSRLRSNA